MHIVIGNDRHYLSGGLGLYTRGATTSLIISEVIPMHGIHQRHTAKSSDVFMYPARFASSRLQNRAMIAALVMVCARVTDFRVPSRCGSLWQPRRLSPLGPLPPTCSGSPFIK